MNVKRISKGSIHRDPSCSPLGKTTDMKLAVPECESTPEQFVGAGGIHSNSSDLKGGLFEFNTAQQSFHSFPCFHVSTIPGFLPLFTSTSWIAGTKKRETSGTKELSELARTKNRKTHFHNSRWKTVYLTF